MKKTVIFLIFVFICYFVNIFLGIAASIAFLAFLFYTHLPDFYMLKGSRAYGLKETEKALSWYKRAMKTGRASAKGKAYYAILLLRSGFPDDAERYLNSAINSPTATPQDKSFAKPFRILTYLKQGRIQEANEDLDELFAEVKNSATYGLKGYFLHLFGTDNAEILRLCKEAYSYNPDDRDIADNLALAYIKCGDYDNAAALLEKLRENFPTFVEGFFHSALLASKTGDNASACEYLAAADKCDRTYLTTVSPEEIDALKQEVGFNA